MSTVLNTRHVTSSRFMFRLLTPTALNVVNNSRTMDEEIHDPPMCILQSRHVASKHGYFESYTVTGPYRPHSFVIVGFRFHVFIRNKNMQTKKISFACFGASSELTVADKACFDSYLLNFRAVIEHFSKFTSADLVMLQ